MLMQQCSEAVCDEPTVASAILRNGCLFRAPAAATLWVNCPSVSDPNPKWVLWLRAYVALPIRLHKEDA